MNFLRGQSYDGAGNMAGVKSGASSNILRLFPKALYFHCSAPRLNLLVAETCKLLSVVNMMDCIRKCCQIFEFSPKKKQGLLQNHIKSDIPKERRERLLNVCRTRWVLRLDGMGREQEMIKPIILALEDIKDNHEGSYQADARTDVYIVLFYRLTSS